MKTAVFGGSFDPVHTGHVALLKACQEKLQFDRILLVPTANPPHKKKIHASDAARLEMLRLAFTEFHGVEIDQRELHKKGHSYTFDLLTELRQEPRLARTKFYFLMGEDSAFDLPQWYRFPAVFDLAQWVVVSRQGTQKRSEKWQDLRAEVENSGRDFDAVLTRIEADLPEISSTRLRQLLSHGVQGAQTFLPAAVAAYLKTSNPYVNSGL